MDQHWLAVGFSGCGFGFGCWFGVCLAGLVLYYRFVHCFAWYGSWVVAWLLGLCSLFA